MMSRLGGGTLTWLGHATLLWKTAGGTSVIIDPWIEGNPKFPADRRHLDNLDVMLLTHGHGDHTGAAVTLAKQFDPTVVCMVELGGLLNSQGVNKDKTIAMNLGGTFKVADFEVSMVEARHSSSYMVDGKPMYAGPPTGLVVRPENGATIYFAGDTSLFSDMKLISEIYKPEIAVLPIGDFYTMGPREAAKAAQILRVKAVVPIHWGTFPVLKGTPAELKQALEGTQIEVIDAEIGVEFN